MDSRVIAATISVIGGIIVAYITSIVAKRKRAAAPKDRMETIFDGYEKLITQQQVEIDRKGNVINSLERVVDRLEQELATTRDLLNEARTDLSSAREQNEKLKSQLSDMKSEYSGSSA